METNTLECPVRSATSAPRHVAPRDTLTRLKEDVDVGFQYYCNHHQVKLRADKYALPRIDELESFLSQFDS